jgi:F-type H+-transporting ATPase subunit epsilon
VLVVCNAAEAPEDIHVRWIREALDEEKSEREECLKIEDPASRKYALKEVDQKRARAKARIHLIELYGSDHQKQRLTELELI